MRLSTSIDNTLSKPINSDRLSALIRESNGKLVQLTNLDYKHTSNSYSFRIDWEKFTLYLNDRKKEAKIRFENRLKSLAFELKVNFQHVGNQENPFVTKAIDNGCVA